MVELGFVIFPLLLCLFGVTVVGLQLGQSVRSSQITRDAASMYVRGVDFTKGPNQDLLVRLAQGMGLAKTGGKGVMIFSRVTWISQQQCSDAGLSPCNGDRHVVTQRVVVGDGSLRTSALGTPPNIDAQGFVLDYMTDPAAIANFPQMQLAAGETAFVTEGFFNTPEITLPGFHSDAGVYNLAIY